MKGAFSSFRGEDFTPYIDSVYGGQGTGNFTRPGSDVSPAYTTPPPAQPTTPNKQDGYTLDPAALKAQFDLMLSQGYTADQIFQEARGVGVPDSVLQSVFPDYIGNIDQIYNPTPDGNIPTPDSLWSPDGYANQVNPADYDLTNPIDIQRMATDEAKNALAMVGDYARTANDPYISLGQESAAKMLDLADRPPAGQSRIDTLSGMNPNISEAFNAPTFEEVNYKTMQNDPMYQYTRDQAQEMTNRNLAAQGLTGSRYAANTLGDVGMQVAQSERDRIYGRNTDTFNRDYGIEADRYNRDYGTQVDNFNRGSTQQQTLYNMDTGSDTTQFNKYASLAGLGQNTAANMGNTAMNWGKNYIDLTTGMADASASNILANQTLKANQDIASDNQLYGLAGTLGSSLLDSKAGQRTLSGIYDGISGLFGG